MRPLTRSCFLLLFLKRLFLLALLFLLEICLPSLWSPPFPLHATAVIPLPSRQGAALAHLDSLPPHDLVLWIDGTVPFPFGKGSSGILANCSLCGTEAILFISAGPVCLSAPFCTPFAVFLGSPNKAVTSLLFSFYLTLVLSSPPSFLLS